MKIYERDASCKARYDVGEPILKTPGRLRLAPVFVDGLDIRFDDLSELWRAGPGPAPIQQLTTLAQKYIVS
jgi:hypothetical protein